MSSRYRVRITTLRNGTELYDPQVKAGMFYKSILGEYTEEYKTHEEALERIERHRGKNISSIKYKEVIEEDEDWED